MNLKTFRQNLPKLMQSIRTVERKDVPMPGDIIVGGVDDNDAQCQLQVGVMEEKTVTYFRDTRFQMTFVSHGKHREGKEYIDGEPLIMNRVTYIPFEVHQP